MPDVLPACLRWRAYTRYFYNAVDCQTFWTAAPDAGEYCSDPTRIDRECVANYTLKIPGDLTAFDVSLFEAFLKKNATAPFLAYMALSTNHVPHYALPEWYHAYTDALGNIAGDYLGTLSQMDDSLGGLRKVLQDNNVEENTMVWSVTAAHSPVARRSRMRFETPFGQSHPSANEPARARAHTHTHQLCSPFLLFLSPLQLAVRIFRPSPSLGSPRTTVRTPCLTATR